MSKPLTLSIISGTNLPPGNVTNQSNNIITQPSFLPVLPKGPHVLPVNPIILNLPNNTNTIRHPIAPLVIQPNTQLPYFNHAGTVPLIVPPTTVQNTTNKPLGRQLSAEEREAKRAEQQRASNARYRDKVRKYKNLGTLHGEKDRIKGMILLCYPHLEEMDPLELDSRVDHFVRSLHD